MMNSKGDPGDDEIGARNAWKKVEYDTSSGDSCWVQQFLEWYHPAGADLAVRDRNTGTPRGFGFVEMESADEADAAIAGLNGTELDGRTVAVNEARSRITKIG